MLTTNEFFKHQSPFLATVRSYGVAYPPNPGVWETDGAQSAGDHESQHGALALDG